MKTRILPWFFVALATARLAGQTISEASVKEKVRYLFSDTHAIHLSSDGSSSKQPARHEIVLNIGRKAGFDRARMQTLLLEFAEEGMLAATPPANVPSPAWEEGGDFPENIRKAHLFAAGSFETLSHIADASSLDRLISLAEAAPRNLEPSATRAVAYTVCRESAEDLPAVARQLTAGRSFSRLYAMLHEVLKYRLPAGANERARLTALIVDVFKEGYRNTRDIFLDRVLEEYAPDFSSSSERKRILTEISASTNPIEQRYAEGKLQGLANAEDEKKREAREEISAGATETKSAAPKKTNEEPHGEAPPVMSPPFIMGGLLVLSALAWLVWRMASRR